MKKATLFGAVRAAKNRLRVQIIDVIRETPGICVTPMYEEKEYITKKGDKIKYPQPVISQHLKILRDSGIVKTRRAGKHIHYTINEPALALLAKFEKEYKDLLADLVPN